MLLKFGGAMPLAKVTRSSPSAVPVAGPLRDVFLFPFENYSADITANGVERMRTG